MRVQSQTVSSRTNDLVLYWGVDSDGVIRDAAFRAGLQLRICPPEALQETSGKWWQWAQSVGLPSASHHQSASPLADASRASANPAIEASAESLVESAGGRRDSRPLAILLADENLKAEVSDVWPASQDSASPGQRRFIEQVPVAIIHRPKEREASPSLSISAMTWLQRLRRSTHLDRDSLQIAEFLKQLNRARERQLIYEKSRRDLGLRNRQLADLRENLERLVQERTKYLAEAERELHRRSQETRELVRFIKDMSAVESVDELLQILTQELRSFHEVRPPILAVASQESGAQIFSVRQKAGGSARSAARALGRSGRSVTWEVRTVHRLWPSRPSIRSHDADDQNYFAQELGRPVARLLTLPLGRMQADSPQPSLLVLEHSLDEAMLQKLTQFMVARLEAISLSLDRVILSREMLAASQLWESTFDGIADPVLVVNATPWDSASPFQAVRMNQSFARHGGRHCYEAFAERSEACQGCRVHEVMRDNQPLEWQVRRGSRVLKASGYPIQISRDSESARAGAPAAIVHYIDVTKNLELRGQAVQGEKMAAIGLMAGNIAHELNNPLAGLRSLAQVLAADASLPEPARQDLREIESAAERSSRIIKDLMDFAELGRDSTQLEVVDVNLVIERAANMLKTAMHEFAVDLSLTEANHALVRVEPHLLQHVIFNIINNACQAMEGLRALDAATEAPSARASSSSQFGLELQVLSRRTDQYVEIVVRDSGPGLSDEVLSRLFQPFFTTKTAGRGTGLGLSMSRMVVESFGGELRGANREDRRGAEFVIRLPSAARESEVGLRS
ncbi:MAG TPA: ATP-binding protein [Pseudobdellovibrionaceae bacterium]|nr:ATP-binding protein [Pseudobdellovibrionaceae bacterium]